jgi:hypothetical protein
LLGVSFIRLRRLDLAEAPLMQALHDIDSHADIVPSDIKLAVLMFLRQVFACTQQKSKIAEFDALSLQHSREMDAKAGRSRKSLTAYKEIALEVRPTAVLLFLWALTFCACA